MYLKIKQWLNRNISVIQLSDRVYNVTFPEKDIYYLRFISIYPIIVHSTS